MTNEKQIIIGNCLEVLKKISSNTIQSVVTSPPYWGLRNYGIEPTIWGGDSKCGHEWVYTKPRRLRKQNEKSGEKQATNKGSVHDLIPGSQCTLCGAWMGVFGDEPSHEMYVEHFSIIAAEIWRVLKDDGTFWLNLGDSYAVSGGPGLKPKDLAGIPWRVAIRLQAEGWWLRQDIIWHKPNAMPESVKDRCVKSHEYIFLLTKNRHYYFDHNAIKEPYTKPLDRWGGNNVIGTAETTQWDSETGHNFNRNRKLRPDPNGRNKRSVWKIPVGHNRESHFAVFPEELPRQCILAGSKQDDIILDPFGGSGTTGLVAQKLGRNFILIEANPEYAQMAKKRIETNNPLFSRVKLSTI